MKKDNKYIRIFHLSMIVLLSLSISGCTTQENKKSSIDSVESVEETVEISSDINISTNTQESSKSIDEYSFEYESPSEESISVEDNRNIIHVSKDGSDELGDGSLISPYLSISYAASTFPGSIIEVHAGEYEPFSLLEDCSGTDFALTTIRAAKDEKVIINANKKVGIQIVNASHITIEDIEINGGTHGIYYMSTKDAISEEIDDIIIKNCIVHDVDGYHGICVYGYNDMIPIANLTIDGCEVYDCECGSSESLVINGNIDGFVIKNNIVHDNDNIGIDMIGFEGTAKHKKGSSDANEYEFDFVRNGICRNNVVYNISADGNSAYYEDGKYNLCADGIYVDGGQDIEIYNNFVYNCDIGIEVATEHSPNKNELFKVSGIKVHDNIITKCSGWTGLCFGGYDKDLGFTENCYFSYNTLIDNNMQICIQRSRDNHINSNIIVGGTVAFDFCCNCPKDEMVNDISNNVYAGYITAKGWLDEYGTKYESRREIMDGYRSLNSAFGSRFVPSDEIVEMVKQ